MVMPAIHRNGWSVAQVQALNDKPEYFPHFEVVDGELLVTKNAPRPAHQRAVTELVIALAAYLAGKQLGEVFTSPSEIRLDGKSMVSPDVFVVPTTAGSHIREWEDVKSLLLVAEVLSPSTARHDRTIKRDHFMGTDVGEYWIVNVERRVFERWTHGRTSVELVADRLVWSPSTDVPAFVLDVPAYFDRVDRKSL